MLSTIVMVSKQTEAKPAKDKKSQASKVSKERKSKASKPSALSHPPYFQMIKEALLALNERTGSSPYAIAKHMEEKHKGVLPVNYKKILAIRLKNFTAKGKLVKVKASFKLSKAGKEEAKLTRKEKKPKKASSGATKKQPAASSKATRVKKARKAASAKTKQTKSIKSPTTRKTKKVAS